MSFKKRKGQNLVLEEVILMSMGIIILVGLTSVFSLTKDEVSSAIQEQEAKHIGNYIKGHISEMTLNNITGTIDLNIPKQINGRYYIIQGYETATKKELSITFNDFSYTTTTPVPVEGSATSQYGSIFINCTKEDGKYVAKIRS